LEKGDKQTYEGKEEAMTDLHLECKSQDYFKAILAPQSTLRPNLELLIIKRNEDLENKNKPKKKNERIITSHGCGLNPW